MRGIRGTVIACWTTDEQVERSILRQGMIHNKKNSTHSPRLSPAQYSLIVQNGGLKYQSFSETSACKIQMLGEINDARIELSFIGTV